MNINDFSQIGFEEAADRVEAIFADGFAIPNAIAIIQEIEQSETLNGSQKFTLLNLVFTKAVRAGERSGKRTMKNLAISAIEAAEI